MLKVRPCQLYRHRDSNGDLLYVGISYSAFARTTTHRSGAHWFADITRIDVEHFPDRKSAEKAEREAIAREKPKHNLAHVPIENMTAQDARDRGLSEKRFSIRSEAHARKARDRAEYEAFVKRFSRHA